MSNRLHVGNIPSATAEQELRTTFGRFGLVETVEIPRNPATGRNQGFAIVSMLDEAAAEAAIRGLNFSQFAGRTIGVGRARKSRGQDQDVLQKDK